MHSSVKKCISILVLMCFFQMPSVFAQTISLNQDGEKIVKYGDGSWRYFDETDPDDIILYQKSDLYKDSVPTDIDKGKSKIAKTKKAKVKKSRKSRGRGKDKLAKTKKAKTKKAKTKKSPKSRSKGKQKIAKASKSKKIKGKESRKPKSRVSSVGSQNYKQQIRKKIIGIRDQQTIAFEKERVASFAASKYEREFKLAKKRKLSKSEIAKVEASYKVAKSQLKDARGQNKVLLKQRRAYEALGKKSGDSLVKSYESLGRKYDSNYKIDPPKNSESLVIKERKKKGSRSSKRNTNNDRYVNEPSDNDEELEWNEESDSAPSAYTVSYPNTKPNANKAALPGCVFAFKGKDSFSGKKRVDLVSSQFFSYTSEKMRRYFVDNDMVQCEAYMSAVAGGYKFLCIEVTVASETAQKSYGSIEKQGLLSLKLVDGTTVNMYNNKTDNGSLDPLKKTVLYKGQYLIPSEHVKTLAKMDIDKVRLVWSTGYEDYIIYESDFLINQLNCLDK